MRALLEKDSKRRLGTGVGGAEAVKAHPFFRRINWRALTARQVGSMVSVKAVHAIINMRAARQDCSCRRHGTKRPALCAH